MRKTLSHIVKVSIGLFFITLILVFLFPDFLGALLLSPAEGKVILMTLISFILLVFFLHVQLGLPWRVFSLIASFITLAESIFMLGNWDSFMK